MDNRHTFSASATQFALACCLFTLTELVALNNSTMHGYYPFILLIYAPALYGINRLFLRRERTMLDVTLLNVLLWAGITGSIIWQMGLEHPEELIFAGAFCVWLTVRGAQMALKAPTLQNLILTLDASALLLVICVGFLSATDRSYLLSLPIAMGFAASVLAMVANRMDRSLEIREWGMIAVAFLLISLVVFLLVGFAAAPAGQGIVTVWNCLVSAVKWLLHLLWQIMLFLNSLFPEQEMGELAMEPTIQIPEAVEEVGETNPLILIILVAFLVLLTLGALIWGICQLRKWKLPKQSRSAKISTRQRNRLSLWAALKRLGEAWVRRMQVRKYLWQNRERPAGLYFLLVHRCRIGPWKKQPRETPREFLTRLQTCAQEDPALAEAIGALISQVDRALFSGHDSDAKVFQASLIRSRVGWAVRRQFLRDCAQQMEQIIQQGKKHLAPSGS
ncbi:hypothetical protein B5E43_04425 [Flavonifractor sp. An100]|nr:hypothetical protein B5E43_04425 [Flavonifractor sp. An100]